MFGSSTFNSVGTLPLHLRNKSNVANISLMESDLLKSRALSLLCYPLQMSLKTALSSAPRGELEYIFKVVCDGYLDKPKELVDSAIEIAAVAETIAVYSTKANQMEHQRILELGAGSSAKPISEKSVNEILSDRVRIDDFIANSENYNTDDAVRAAARGPVSSCLAYTGIGKVRNVIDVLSIANHMKSLMLWISDSLSPDLRCRGYTALSIYLAALNEYDSGLFASKVTLNPQGLYNAKMLGMIDYSHMFSAVALSDKLLTLALSQMQIEALAFLVKSMSPWRWSSAVEDIYRRNENALASLLSKHPLLPYKAIVTACTAVISASGSSYWAPLSKLSKDFNPSTFSTLSGIPVVPGEASLYLPGEQVSMVTEPQKTEWMVDLHSALQAQHERIMGMDYTISAIQIADYIRPRLRVDYAVSSFPEFLRPRLSTCSDQLPFSIGLRQQDNTRTRVLSRYINGVMSYRNVHDQLSEQFPYSARFGAIDYSAFLNVNKALITLPIPDVYLRGESFSSIYLDEQNMTAIMHREGAVDNLTYTKTVQLLMFSMDKKYYSYYAYLLSGAFLVVMKTSSVPKGVAAMSIFPDYSVILPGSAPISSIYIPVSQKKLNQKDFTSTYTYGVPSEALIAANVKVWQNIFLSDSKDMDFDMVMRRLLWADGEFEFGLLPLAIIPAPRVTEYDYCVIDGKTVLQISRFRSQDIGDIKYLEGFRWTDISAPIPHMTTAFVPTEKIKPYLSRIAFAGGESVAYVGDVITRPDPSDLLHSPEAWRGPRSPSPSAPPPVDLSAIQPLPQPVTNDLPPAPEPPKPVVQTEVLPSLVPETGISQEAVPVDMETPAQLPDSLPPEATEEDKKKKKKPEGSASEEQTPA